MDKRKKQMLRHRAKAIEDLKKDYYIGSLEAFNLIKNTDESSLSPVIASNIINNSLDFNPINYPATPERITGVHRIINRNVDTSLIRYMPYALESFFQSMDLRSIYFTDSAFDCSSDDLFGFFKDYFKKANLERVVLDCEFKELFIEEFVKKIVNYVRSQNFVNKFSLSFIEQLSGLFKDENWSEELSSDYYCRDVSENFKSRLYFDISTEKIVDRLKKDRVEHRLGYRRQVLCKWLLDREYENYEDALKDCEEWIKLEKLRLERLKKARYPDFAVKRGEMYLPELLFIRNLLGSEKNFIRRFLKS